MAKKKKDNFLLFILKFPFLCIFHVFDFIVQLFKYECLGCYYVLYGLFFPILFIFKKTGDNAYKVYKKQEVKKEEKINDPIPESVNLDTGTNEFKKAEEEIKPIKEQKSVESLFKEKYYSLPFVKKQQEKEALQIANLAKTIEAENYRSEKPIVFRYIARDADGKKETNIFLGYSRMEVLSYLNNEGYKVISIETSKWLQFAYGGQTSASTYKLKNKDLIFWLTQLATYIKAGIPLTDAMRILGKQMSKNPRKKRLFDSIIYNLTLGSSFSTALENQGKSFPALLISMIKTAEATGELEKTLEEMAEYYTETENTRKSMISAMSYPAIISIFSIGVVVFIMLYVIPQFQDIYAQSGATLNKFTLAIISFSKFLENNVINLLLILVVVVIILTFLYKKVKVFRKMMQELIMRLPLIGKIIIYKEMNIFAKTFSSLLKNNVFITDSINLLSEVTNNEIYKEIMYKTVYYITKGDKISTAFKEHWAVPEVAYYMIVTGESTGELGDMMGKVADYYQTEHKTIVNSMKSFIEPAMIIFLAVVVGGIVMAIILPMFGLYSQIQ